MRGLPCAGRAVGLRLWASARAAFLASRADAGRQDLNLQPDRSEREEKGQLPWAFVQDRSHSLRVVEGVSDAKLVR
jgi:hypothetical protein